MNRWIDQELGDATVQRGMAVIAELIRRGRQGAGITQARLADAVGMHQSTISRLERAELRAMRLVRLARVIGTIVEYRGLAAPERPRRRRPRSR
jgi:transcriptional regulator with XRE-family HTH domain